MSRRAFALAALACSLLLAGCGVNHHDIVASTVISTPTNAEVPNGQTSPEDTKAIKHVTVVVLDRLSSAPVADAIVTLGQQSATTDKDGIATFPRLPHRRYIAEVAAKGYDTQRERIRLRPTHRFAVVRVWRPGWSWPVYGGDAARTQSPAGINLRPHLRLRWGLKLDEPHRVPARHGAGDRLRDHLEGHADRVRDRQRQRRLAPTAERAHGRLARRRRRARLRRLVPGADPRVRCARRPPALAEGARRGLRELAAGRRRSAALRGQRRARARARPRDRQAALDRRRRRQGDDGRDRRERARDRRRLRRQGARARPAHGASALAGGRRGPAVRRHRGPGRAASSCRARPTRT